VGNKTQFDPVHNAPLVGRHVRLRPILPSDYEYLYELETNEQITWRWRFRGTTPSPEQFAQMLWEGVLVQFIVEHRETRQRIGRVLAYEANDRHGWCHFAIVMDPSLNRMGWTLEALALFLNYLFKTWNFRKLYAETPEYVYDDFASGAGSSFHVEGRLGRHEWFQGRYWDLLLLAMYREDFEQGLGARIVAHAAGAPAPQQSRPS
jgi:RimJ/RimL family protein N-acetyltransferase